MLVGSIEAGGTKFVCAVGDEDYRIKDSVHFPTTTPEETLQKAVDYFKKFDIEALGIASFGPIELRKKIHQNMVTLHLHQSQVGKTLISSAR